MLKSIEIIPIAFESFGVRSMCTYIRTPDIRILVDSGISLGPRYALLPHPLEYKARMECRGKLAEVADSADVLTVSHYHFDHFTPSYRDTVWNGSSLEVARRIYQDKIILRKDIRNFINLSQRRRGWIFEKALGKLSKRMEIADGKTFTFGETVLRFSKPVFHGEEGSMLGWVLMLTVEYEEEKVVHAPDVQGPIVDETLRLLLEERPNLLIIGGPALYLADFRVSKKVIDKGLDNLVKIVQEVPTIILEHHLLRAENWKEYSRKLFEEADRVRHQVLTAAEYLGEKNKFLESQRRVLYKKYPPSEEFVRWTKLPAKKRREKEVPIDE